MSARPEPRTMADLPAQLPAAPETTPQQRARFFNSGNAFNIILPPVPDAAFTEQPLQALDADTPSGLIHCDAGAQMGTDEPATSPLLLASYARIREGETLKTDHLASGVVYYVIRGSGSTSCNAENIHWQSGDVFLLPGGTASHSADTDAVLWLVSNQPHLSFENVRLPESDEASTGPVHYPAAEIERQMDLIYEVGSDEAIAGLALIFSSEQQQACRNVLPVFTLALNSLPPGGAQRAHKHNAVAVSLVVQGEGCYSMIDGKRKDWSDWATTVTPPGSVHSHHNEGSRQARFLIVQDGGLYYHARAMGFEFAGD